ncbi:hypothetical protein H7K45_27915 [Mycobacterium yunnanensis]|uniref:DUF1508 domain-containing protein n=1 Tax=Mycobacterium yunnanensis TaxID=368477 RepID=A0A9X2YRZ9_9MYCO|nr:hypothetical protein [Mycobacterium yunnanensis]MCV7424378.1 hypothetical protein [Mycobacterium yunnanensis]
MKRPHLVNQRENEQGDFWCTVRGGNGANLLTSETYPSRSNAVRAARAYIASVDPVPVVFTYWTGDRPRDVGQTARGLVRSAKTERIR